MKIVLGTMTFGKQATPVDAVAQLKEFFSRGHDEIDTARMYVDGRTEEIIGDILKDPASGFNLASVKIASKVNPGTSFCNFTPEKIKSQSDEILAALCVESTDILYLHWPDINNPIEETLQTVQELYEQKRFRFLGLSNYPAWEVVYIHCYCSSKGWVTPSVYQGMYNAITRDVEKELLPALKKLNMCFYAYNPLGGGILTGKHRPEGTDPSGTRFDASNQLYRNRYWKPEYFAALDILKAACDGEGIQVSDASIRWLIHHSQLNDAKGDAIIVGASKLDHLTANLDSAVSGPLPQIIVDAFEAAWETTRPACEKYFRP